MLARTHTTMFANCQPLPVEVEVDGNRGVPSLVLIGLASKATNEARQRITAALQNLGVRIRSKRTVVNLAPADIPKHGSSFDVAIAIGVLKMYGELQADTDDCLFLGELSLEGRLKPIHGCLPLVLAAREWGFRRVFIPMGNTGEVTVVEGIAIYPVEQLAALVGHLRLEKPLARLQPVRYEELITPQPNTGNTFDEIIGQEDVKRAVAIAAAGGHHTLLSGSPGIGKTLLAQAMVSLLPPLTKPQALQLTKLYSFAGVGSGGLLTHPPFRSPHHTISRAGLIGGGNPLRPGEVSLANQGILFLDEFCEFPTHLLEVLRQPLETHRITVSRPNGQVEFPAHFTLVAATNPCQCGYANSTKQRCRCLPGNIRRYQQKLSGPLLDRFDLRIQVPELEYQKVSLLAAAKPLVNYRQKVSHAREKQQQRFAKENITLNSEMTSAQVKQFCQITSAAEQLLNQALDRLHLSVRSYFKIIKAAQTIADFDGAEQVDRKQIAEVLQYRQI